MPAIMSIYLFGTLNFYLFKILIKTNINPDMNIIRESTVGINNYLKHEKIL